MRMQQKSAIQRWASCLPHLYMTSVHAAAFSHLVYVVTFDVSFLTSSSQIIRQRALQNSTCFEREAIDICTARMHLTGSHNLRTGGNLLLPRGYKDGSVIYGLLSHCSNHGTCS